MQFSFKVKKKSAYDRGVVVVGKVLSGTITKDDDAIVIIGNSEYKVHIDFIIDRPDGGYVLNCNSGNNVTLFLSGIKSQLVKPKITIIKNFENLIPEVSKNNSNTDAEGIKQEKALEESTSKVISLKKIEAKSNMNVFSSVEKNFVQDIVMCLKSNGRIAPTELYVLDKLRIVYNISEERGHQLIVDTIKKYDAEKNEIIYRDAVSACLLDCGYLTATESYLLEKLRIALNIPECKAYTIEKESDWDV